MSHTKMLRLMVATSRTDPDLHAWLTAGYRRWRDGEGLERALDLVGAGADRAAGESLLIAAELLDRTHAKSAWQMAALISAALARFESRTWPRVRAIGDPGTLGEIDRVFWDTLTISERVPRSPRRLYDLLTRAGWRRQLEPGDDADAQSSRQPETTVENQCE